MRVYHGTIKGYWDLALQHDELRPFHPEVIKQFINQATPLLLGYAEWLDNRLQEFNKSKGKVYLSDSKENASRYAITYPEIVTSCIIRLNERIQKGDFQKTQIKTIIQPLKQLHAYFQENDAPLVVTLDIPKEYFVYTGTPTEIQLVKPVKITGYSVSTESVKEKHLFFLYYDRLKGTLRQKGYEF